MKNGLPFFVCRACNRNPWSHANLSETRKQNNKHGSLITRTGKGVLAFPAGGPEATDCLSAWVSRVPHGCHSVTTDNFPLSGRPHFQILSVYQKFSERILLFASPPLGHFLPPKITLRLHPTMPLDAPRPPSTQSAISPSLASLLPAAGESGC